MIPNNSGKIINIASIAGFGDSRPDGGVFSVAYNTSKGALITLTQALATEWGKHNINVNAICPGYFPTQRPSMRTSSVPDAGHVNVLRIKVALDFSLCVKLRQMVLCRIGRRRVLARFIETKDCP